MRASRLGNGRTCAAASDRPRGRSRPQRFWCTYAVLPVRLCRSAVPGRLGTLGVLTSHSAGQHCCNSAQRLFEDMLTLRSVAKLCPKSRHRCRVRSMHSAIAEGQEKA